MLNELSDVDFDSLINSLVTSFTSGSTGLAAVLVNMISNDDLQKRVMDSIAMSSVISDDQKASILEALPSAENLQNRMFNALETADPTQLGAKLLLAGGYSDLILSYWPMPRRSPRYQRLSQRTLETPMFRSLCSRTR